MYEKSIAKRWISIDGLLVICLTDFSAKVILLHSKVSKQFFYEITNKSLFLMRLIVKDENL